MTEENVAVIRPSGSFDSAVLDESESLVPDADIPVAGDFVAVFSDDIGAMADRIAGAETILQSVATGEEVTAGEGGSSSEMEGSQALNLA